jgi:hypothetical protein
LGGGKEKHSLMSDDDESTQYLELNLQDLLISTENRNPNPPTSIPIPESTQYISMKRCDFENFTPQNVIERYQTERVPIEYWEGILCGNLDW